MGYANPGKANTPVIKSVSKKATTKDSEKPKLPGSEANKEFIKSMDR